MEIPIGKLRSLDLRDLLALMKKLGISIEGIEERTAALTKLMSTAVES